MDSDIRGLETTPTGAVEPPSPPQSPSSAPLPQTPELYRWSLLDLVIVGLGVTAATLWAVILADQFAGPDGAIINTWGMVLAFGLQAVGLILSFTLLGAYRQGIGLGEAGLRMVSWVWLLIGTAVALGAMPVRIAIGLIVMLLIDPSLESLQGGAANPFALPDVTLASAALMTVIGGLLIPIGEEMFFRGVLYRWLRIHSGVWAAALISGAIFGAAHIFPPTAAAAFVLGVIMALTYEYSRSLWVPIIVHAVNNTIIFGLLYGSLLLIKWLDIPMPY